MESETTATTQLAAMNQPETPTIESAGSSYPPDGIAIHAAYNKVIRLCAERRKSVHLVPMYEEFLGHGFRCKQFWRSTYDSNDPFYWYGSNLEDPNDRGYDAIRRLFLIEIEKILN